MLRTAGGIVVGYRNGRSILPSTSLANLPGRGRIISSDNCCQEAWQCNSDQDWAEGYIAFQNGSRALAGLISVVGDPAFVDLYERALDLLRTRLPYQYSYALDGLNKIEERVGSLTGVMGWQIFLIRQDGHFGVPSSPRVERVASMLVHEACHIHRRNAGYRIPGRCDREGAIREEAACETMELEVLIGLGVEPAWIESQRNLIACILSGEHSVVSC